MEYLVFCGSKNNKTFLLKSENRSEINNAIQRFLDEHNFRSYYWRLCRNDKCTWIDVGSYTEFFYIFDTEEKMNKFLTDEHTMLYRM